MTGAGAQRTVSSVRGPCSTSSCGVRLTAAGTLLRLRVPELELVCTTRPRERHAPAPGLRKLDPGRARPALDRAVLGLADGLVVLHPLRGDLQVGERLHRVL